MKKIIALFPFGLILTVSIASAQPKEFGLGIIIGEPTGLSWEYGRASNQSLAGALAWSLRKDNAFYLHVDNLFYGEDFVTEDRSRTMLYFGVGGRLILWDESVLGLRIPLGVAHLFRPVPIKIFLEIVPVLDLFPETQFDLSAALGVRYFFPR